MSLLRLTQHGLYCEAGDFFVDPWEPVDRAVITHAHGDHATWGSRAYLTSEPGVEVLRARLEPGAAIRGVEYGETVALNGTTVSLHPAGHILGSAWTAATAARREAREVGAEGLMLKRLSAGYGGRPSPGRLVEVEGGSSAPAGTSRESRCGFPRWGGGEPTRRRRRRIRSRV